MDLAMIILPVHCHGNSLLQRSFFFPRPDPGFDLTTASPEQLDQFGIIPKPDPKLQPVLYHAWLRLFGPPVTVVAPEFQEVRALWQINTYPQKPTSAFAGLSRFETSANWSGASLAATDDMMFVLVAGQWTLPTLNLPPPEHIVPTASQYVCSTWVGLDGQRSYLNSSLPQVGVMQTLTLSPPAGPDPSAVAFFQWWDRENGGSFLPLHGLAVQAGDVMVGAVWAITETVVIYYLRNDTTGELTIAGALSPTVNLPVGPPIQLTITGATSEWILERPTKFGSTDLYPFPDYGSTAFDWCVAGTAPGAGPPQSARDLTRARFIRMYDTMSDPPRTEFISMPSRIDDIGVKLDYGSFAV